MALRDFLLGAQQFQQGAQQYAEGTKRVRQQEAQQEFQQRAPELIQKIRSGTPEEQSAALADINNLNIQSGGNDQSVAMLFKSVLGGGAQANPLTPEQLMVVDPSINPETAKASAGLDRKAQELLLKQKTSATKEAGTQSRSDRASSQRNESMTNAQGKEAFNVLNKNKDAFRAEKYDLKSIQRALDRGTAIDDNLVFNFIARHEAGEKGPLSDSDVRRAMGVIGIEGGLEEFKARFSGGNYSKLSPAQKQAFTDIVKDASLRFNDKAADAYAQDMNDLYHSQTRSKDAAGNPTGILKSTLAELKNQKIPVEFDSKTKSFVVSRPSVKSTGGVTKLINAANSIKDPAIKNKYLQYFNANKTRNFSDEEVSHILQKISGGQ